MIVIIDHYDSFIYNIIDIVKGYGYDVYHVFYDKISCDQLAELSPKKIILSPGPKHPDDAPQTKDIVHFCAAHNIPVLGICLGHQIIGAAYGAEIYQTYPMHGIADAITHDGEGIFYGLANPFDAARYHSLSVAFNDMSGALKKIAVQKDGLIMGLKHVKYPLFGVQFHPESILTVNGNKIIYNFLNI